MVHLLCGANLFYVNPQTNAKLIRWNGEIDQVARAIEENPMQRLCL